MQGGGTMLVLVGRPRRSGDVLVGSGTTLVASETVSAGGVATGTVLSNTGLLTVLSGGEADGTVITNNPLGTSGGLVVSVGGLGLRRDRQHRRHGQRGGRHGERGRRSWAAAR